jgi:hypothetical protein
MNSSDPLERSACTTRGTEPRCFLCLRDVRNRRSLLVTFSDDFLISVLLIVRERQLLDPASTGPTRHNGLTAALRAISGSVSNLSTPENKANTPKNYVEP